jgi:hypothetical protein
MKASLWIGGVRGRNDHSAILILLSYGTNAAPDAESLLTIDRYRRPATCDELSNPLLKCVVSQ